MAPVFHNLNPLGFYLWGHLKGVMFAAAVNDVLDLQQHIADGCQVIQNMSRMFEQSLTVMYSAPCGSEESTF
jgi:hypothetical protein